MSAAQNSDILWPARSQTKTPPSTSSPASEEVGVCKQSAAAAAAAVLFEDGFQRDQTEGPFLFDCPLPPV